MEKDLVSIILPIYNVEKYLEEAVKSAVFQTYPKKEIILVDDGSPDGSPKLCDNLAEKYGNITVVHKKNGGLSDARNAGIKVANGEFLYFFDSDDVIHPQLIEFLVEAIKHSECDFSECCYSTIKDYSEAFFDIQTMTPVIEENLYDYFKSLALWQYNIPMVWTKLFKAETFKKLKFEKGKIHEDEILLTSLLKTLKRVNTITNRLYFYRTREGSIMAKPYSEKRLIVYDCFKERYDTLKKKDPCLAKNQLIYTINTFLLAIKEMKTTDTKESVKFIKEITKKLKSLYKEMLNLEIDSFYINQIKLAFENPKDFFENFNIDFKLSEFCFK